MIRVVTLLLAIATVSWATEPRYDIAIFREEIDAKCLNKLWSAPGPDNNIRPTGQTLESFIAMVEKVEAIHDDWNIYEVSRALLKRFAFEEMEFQELAKVRSGKQKESFGRRWNIMAKLLGDDTDSKIFQEDDLSEEEKCTMFFMMGHLVNNTYREGVDHESTLSEEPLDAPPDSDMPGGILKAPPVKRVAQPREQGVVNVKGTSHQAISISKVLNALLASQNTNDEYINKLYGTKISQDLKINALLGVTLGDVLSVAVIHHESKEDGAKFFGPGGTWNSTACPTEFVLNKEPEGTTNALLRGAVDGVLISHGISQLGGSDIGGLRLSRALRMYYSAKGIPQINRVKDGYSYCRRNEVASIMGQSAIHDSVLAFSQVLMYKLNGQELIDTVKVEDAVKQLINALVEMNQYSGTEECQVPLSLDQPICETPNNVFVILDTSERESGGIKDQENIVGQLSSRLDFGRGVGSLNVFYDSKDKDQNKNELLAISYNDTDPTCAACQASRVVEEDDFPERPNSEVVVLDGLNKTLMNFERKYDLEPGVPNKVVVMFHYDEIRESNQKRLEGAVNILRDGHRDTRIIVVGSENALSVLAGGTSNVVTRNQVTNKLLGKICRVPAVFQYNRCFDHKKGTRNEDKNVYTGYVTDNHVQFWAFYPEYFLKSYNIKIKFHVEDGDIIVCSDRGVDNPGYKGDTFNKDDCKPTDSNNRELTFTFQNPCEGYQVHDCKPINFAIVGDSKLQAKLDCPVDDDKCRRFDQIKFHVSHEGVFCSGSEFLKSSIHLTLAAAAVYLFRRF